MEFNNISTLNSYELIKKYLSRNNLSSHITKHLVTATQKPVDEIFSSKINDSFVILKFQENQNRSTFFKYIPSSEELSDTNYDRIESSSSTKSIVGIDYNNNSLYFILNIGNTYSIVTPNNIINYESLTLKESQKLSNEIGKKYIIKIACGENHCLFLTHAGMVYTLGDNSFGQLGIGQNNMTKETKEGLMLKDLLNYRISDIASGKNHSFCFGVVREMTKAGSTIPNNNMEFDPKTSYFLFGWGDNSFFQLGMKQVNRNKLVLKPTKIYCTTNFHNPAIIGEELINICCGLNFTSLLFRNGKLLTFGDNQYNQLIYKENEILPNFANNYIPENLGKIVKIINAGNSSMLISENNKIVIFGKFNENKDEIKIIDLVENNENYKYIFNDQILKVVFFSNEITKKKIFENIQTVKIEEFLQNTKLHKSIQQNKTKVNEINNLNTNNNNKINSLNASNRSNNSFKTNNNTNNNLSTPTRIPTNKKNLTEKMVYESNINDKTEISPNNNQNNKIKTSLNDNSIPNSSLNIPKKYSDFKTVAKKFQNVQKHKYKNSYTIQSTINENNKKFNIYQTKNSKLKIELKKEDNGADNVLKQTKTIENNGNTNLIENKLDNNVKEEKNNNKKIISPFSISNKDNNTITNESTDNKNIINGNKNENGNSNKNIFINKMEIDNNSFLNKNVLKNIPQKYPIKNRYDDNYNSLFNEKKEKENNNEIKNENKLNIENKEENNRIEIKHNYNEKKENSINNGGIINNGQNIENPSKTNILKGNNEIELKKEINTNNNQINNILMPNLIKKNESIKIQNKELLLDNNVQQKKGSLHSNYNLGKKIDEENKTIIKKEFEENIILNVNNRELDNNENNYKNNKVTIKNIDNNINNVNNNANNKINYTNINTKNIVNDNMYNKNNNLTNINNINNNKSRTNNNLNNVTNKNINNNTNNKTSNIIYRDDNINKNINNNIHNVNINNNYTNNNINKLNPSIKPLQQNKGLNINYNSKYNISISKKYEEEDDDYDIFKSINNNTKKNLVNNNINSNSNINKNTTNNRNDITKNESKITENNLNKLLSQNKDTKKEKIQNNPSSLQNTKKENKENINIFRELSQFVSTTVNKINKYSQNKSDAKKDSFFEEIVSNNNSNFRGINPKILIKNIISGVPNRYRGRFWLKCIGNQLSITPDYFDINISKYYEKYEDSKTIKYKLPFPYLGIFKEDTPLTSDLVEVINGFVISRPDIEYNEKISYLVGMLIINMDKYQAYVSFMNLILNPNLIIYYLDKDKDENIMEYGYTDTPGRDENNNEIKPKKIPSIVEKNLRRVIFKQLLFHNLPDLCSHLELLNVLPEHYFDEWNETIFCKNFNIDISMKIWDLFVVQGEKIVFDAGIALIKELQDDLFNCEEKEEVLDILLNSQMREINEANILKEIQKVEYPEWIQSEVQNMSEETVIPISFIKS